MLVEHRDIVDSELGGSFPVKVWESDKLGDTDTWQHREIRVMPGTNVPEREAIVLRENGSERGPGCRGDR